jgi:hypothetical protein
MRADQRGEHLPDDLAQARSRFQTWRHRRTSRSPIPFHLWALAVRLVQRHGLSRTASALGLGYYSLKKHVEQTATPSPSRGPAFVELPAPGGLDKQCQLDVDNGAGATLRVQLLGYDAAEVAVVARTFWSAT